MNLGVTINSWKNSKSQNFDMLFLENIPKHHTLLSLNTSITQTGFESLSGVINSFLSLSTLFSKFITCPTMLT